MKKLIGIALLTLFYTTNCVAQWRLIYPNEKYNYLLSDQTDSIIRTTIWVDSVELINNDSVFYLNRIFKKNGYVSGPIGSNQIFLINQPQFLKMKVIALLNNFQKLDGDTSWYINGNCQAGDSWIFDSILNKTAICNSVYQSTFFGITDSVKRIVIDFSDTILLTKYHGVLTFPKFDSAHQHYNLVGLEKQNVGLTVPEAFDFCNFNVGDEFEFENSYSSTQYTSGAHTSYSTTYYRYLILSKVANNDSVVYHVWWKRKSDVHPFGSASYINIDTGSYNDVTYYLTNSGNYLNNNFNMQYSYNLANGSISWNILDADTIGNGYSKHFYSSNCSPYGLSSVLIGSTAPIGSSFVSENNSSQLFGTYKSSNGSATGIPLSGSSSGGSHLLMAAKVSGNQYGQFLPANTYHDCNFDTIYSNFIVSDKDTLINADTTAILNSNFLSSTYLWSTGAVSNTITIHQAGVYTLTVTNSYGCANVSKKHIFLFRNVDSNYIVTSDSDLCNNSETILSSAIAGFSYLWSTGSTQSSIKTSLAGTYFLTTTDVYGLSSMRSMLIKNTPIIPFNWPHDTVIKYGNNVSLQMPLSYKSYIWNDGSSNFIKTFSSNNLKTGINKIWASAFINNCTVSDTILIFVSPDEFTINNNFEHFYFIENGNLNFVPTTYNCTYQLYSITGNLMFSKSGVGLQKTDPFYLNSLNSGIYLLRITTADRTYTGKIFIKNQ